MQNPGAISSPGVMRRVRPCRALAVGGAIVLAGVVSSRIPATPMLGVACLAAVLFALVSVTASARAGVVLVVLLAFASRLSVSVFGLHVRAEHFAILGLMGILAGGGRLHLMLRNVFRPPCSYFAIYLAYAAAISLLVSPSKGASTTILVWLLLDLLLLASLVTVRVPKAVLYDSIAAAAMLSGLAAIGLWVLAEKTGSTLGIQQDPGSAPAVFALSYEANLLAGVLVVSSLVLLSQPSAERRSRHTLAATVALASVPTTQTRAAFVAAILGLFILALRSRGGGGRTGLLAVAGGAVILMFGAATSALDLQVLLEKFGHTADFQSGNGGYRLQIQRQAMADLSAPRDLVFGFGVNSFPQRHTDPSRPTEAAPGYLSNLPLQIAYDTGLVGMSLLALFVGSVWRRCRDKMRAAAVGSALFTISLATSPFWFATTWIFIALAVSHEGPDRRRPLLRNSLEAEPASGRVKTVRGLGIAGVQ